MTYEHVCNEMATTVVIATATITSGAWYKLVIEDCQILKLILLMRVIKTKTHWI